MRDLSRILLVFDHRIPCQHYAALIPLLVLLLLTCKQVSNLLTQAHHWPVGLSPIEVSNAGLMAIMTLDCIQRPDIDRSTLPASSRPNFLKLPDFSAFRIASSNPGRVCRKVRLPEVHTWPGVGHPKILMAFKSLGNRAHSTMLHIM